MSGASAGLTAQIAAHVAGTTFESLPASSIHAAKRALLDGVGVMLAASGMSPDVLPFVALARSRMSATGATVLGHGIRTDAASAALANGAMSHALDFEDAFDLAPVHPNASLIPAALAIAETHGPVSGAELITAIAIGCDLACRLGLSLRRPMELGGWYPPPILASFGAAAAAARLLHLSPAQVADTFSMMLCQISCPGEIKHSADTVLRAVREAFPAQAAVTCALLAAHGVRGFERPLEGQAGFFRLFADNHYDQSALLDDLGSSYWIEQLSFKPWPACRGTHACIEAVLQLARDHDFGWDQVTEIRLEGGEVQQMLALPEARKKRPATPIDAKFSLPFTVAVALLRGNVTLDDFSPSSLIDTELLALAARVSYRTRPGWGRDHAACGSVEIILADGRHLAAEILEPLGSPDKPLDDEQLTAKFLDCAGRSARPAQSAQAELSAKRILTIENELNVAEIIAGL